MNNNIVPKPLTRGCEVSVMWLAVCIESDSRIIVW